MWVVLMYTKGGAQYEYTVIPESKNPTRDEIVGCAVQSHTLNCLSGIVPTYKDGRSEIREVIIMTSIQEFSQYPALSV